MASFYVPAVEGSEQELPPEEGSAVLAAYPARKAGVVVGARPGMAAAVIYDLGQVCP